MNAPGTWASESRSGVSVDQLAAAWAVFTKNLDSGKVESAGVEVRGVLGVRLSPSEILVNTAERMHLLASRSERDYDPTVLALRLFGRNGLALMPFLNSGRGGLESLPWSEVPGGPSFAGSGPDVVMRDGVPHNLFAHPLLVLCPRLGRWLHGRTDPVVPTWGARWRRRFDRTGS